MNMKYLIFLLVTISLSACRDKCNGAYDLLVPIETSPKAESYKIGDTLRVSITTDNMKVFDQWGNRTISIPNFDVNAWFVMPRLDSLSIGDGFLENELIIDDKYEVEHMPVSTLTSGIFFLDIDTTEFVSKLDFKIVFDQMGTYGLYAMSGLYSRDQSKRVEFDDRCSRRGTLDGTFHYPNGNNESILTVQNMAIEDEFWSERSGQRVLSFPYYFRVEE